VLLNPEIQINFMKHKISTLGSHSALDVCEGAKKEGFETLVAVQKGRDKTYAKHYRTRKCGDEELGVVDEVLELERFKEIVKQKSQEKLKNSIFVPNRSFAVYVGYDNIENEFAIPIFGNKYLLRAEERDAEKNQYHLMEKAGVRTPRKFSKPSEIDRLCIVKASEAKRSYERAFFLASSPEEYDAKGSQLIEKGKTNEEQLKKAVIEEYIIGTHFNLNFFYSKVHERLELLGIDTRRQTNIEGYLRMPAKEQTELGESFQPSTIEVGHIACTLRESLLEQSIELGEKFVSAVEKEYEDGIGGPFALQGAFIEEDGEKFVCFDVSLRMPGSPGTRFTPYSEYLFRKSISFGRRIAIEIKDAEKEGKIEKITT